MRIAVMESKPKANINGIKIAYNGMISSLIPKVEPPRLKITMAIGISNIPFVLSLPAKAINARSIAPVCKMIPKAPPTTRTKATTSAALIMPSIGALAIWAKPCLKSPCSLVLGTVW
ncbi:hypothetical protein D3C73_584570 [compost metagenome]